MGCPAPSLASNQVIKQLFLCRLFNVALDSALDVTWCAQQRLSIRYRSEATSNRVKFSIERFASASLSDCYQPVKSISLCVSWCTLPVLFLRGSKTEMRECVRINTHKPPKLTPQLQLISEYHCCVVCIPLLHVYIYKNMNIYFFGIEILLL